MDSETNSELSDNESEVEQYAEPSSPTKEGRLTLPDTSLVWQSAFDNYFTLMSRSAQTSSSVFSQEVEPLTAAEFAKHLQSIDSSVSPAYKQRLDSLEASHSQFLPLYLLELTRGFHLLFHGLGSKRRVLNRLATEVCAKHGHVVVANGFLPGFGVGDFLRSIERVPGVEDAPPLAGTGSGLGLGAGIDARARRICDFFTPKGTEAGSSMHGARHLFIILHSLDAFLYRTPKAGALIARLAACPNIHIAASTDNINATLQFGLVTHSRDSASHHSAYSWLRHDLTTLRSYDFELAYADRTSYAGASLARSGELAKGAAGSGPMSETAARHVLASVTEKAKKLFKLLVGKQLEALADTAQARSGRAAQQLSDTAITYDMLFALARDNFLASNDTAMRALLSEFRDHNLIMSTSGEGGELMWIPLPAEALRRVSNAHEAGTD